MKCCKSCLWLWFGLNFYLAKLISLDNVFLGSTTMGLETCARSSGNNWECISGSKFQSTPLPPLVAKSFSANDITLPHFFRVTRQSNRSLPSFCLGHVIFPAKTEQTNKNPFTRAICMIWSKGLLNYICHSHPSIESKSTISCSFFSLSDCWFFQYPKFPLVTHLQNQTCVSGFHSFHTQSKLRCHSFFYSVPQILLPLVFSRNSFCTLLLHVPTSLTFSRSWT